MTHIRRRLARRAVAAARRRAAGLWRQQEGIGLIEVMVSAALVLTVAAAVLGSIDGASRSSGRLAAQATAANLAQQDLERMRALRVTVLGNLHQTRSVTVRGASYSIDSSGTYVSDRSETPGCTSTASADYIRITSSVNSNALRDPVKLDTMVSPSIGSVSAGTGGLVVQVRDAAAGPVSGLLVTLSGAGSFSQSTSSEGCAFFAYIPTGSYTISYSRAGWVDQGGNQDISMPATVNADQTNSYQTTYDRAGEIDAQIETRVGSVTQAGTAEAVTVTNANLPGSGSRTTPAPAPGSAATVPIAKLFPFTSPYAVYSGDCSASALPSSLKSALPAGTYTTSQLVAGGTVYGVKVFEPAIDLHVTYGGSPAGGARVFMTQTSSGCADVISQTTQSDGTVPDPGVPYNTYTVCADIVQPGKTYRTRAMVAGVVNDQLTGKRVDLAIPTVTAANPCP